MVNTFTNASDTDFSNTTNWSDGALPGTTETFYIQGDAVLSEDVEVGTFTLYNGETLDLNGWELDCDSGSGVIYIGNSVAATSTTKLLINGGDLKAPASIGTRGTPDLHITTGRIVSCDDFNWGNDTYDAKMYVDNASGTTEFMTYCNQFAGGHLIVSGAGSVDDSGLGGSATAICKRFNWQRMEAGNSRITFRSGESESAEGDSAYTYLASGEFYDLWYNDLDDTVNHYHTIIGDITCRNIINVSSTASTYHPVLRCLGQKEYGDSTNSFKQTIICSGENDPYTSTGSCWVQAYCTVSGGFADFDLGAHAQVGNVPYVNRHWGVGIESNAAFYAEGTHAGLFDGTDDYINVGDDASLDLGTGDFSFSGWIKLNNPSAGDFNMIYDKGASTGQKRYGFLIYNNDTLALHLDSAFNSSLTITDTDWHFVAVSCDRDGNAMFHLDGASDTVDISSKSGDSLSSTSDLRIGAKYDLSDHFFDGFVADLRIFSAAVSSGTVNTTLYGAGNPATNVSNTYATEVGNELAQWKLNTTGRTVLGRTRAFDVTDSINSNDGTNNGVTSAEPWITMSSWRNNQGQFWVKNGYLEWKGRHSTGAYGEWGKHPSQGGPANDFEGSYLDQQLKTSSVYQVYGNDPDAGIICKEWNIWPKSGNDRTGKIYGGSGGPTCLVDVTGNLCINSEFADGGNDETIFEPYETGPNKYFALTADNIYVSGTLNWAESEYTPADSEWATVLATQTVTARSTLYIGETGTYVATPGMTIAKGNPGWVLEGAASDFQHSSGTAVFADSVEGGWTFSGQDWTGDNKFYDITLSGANIYRAGVAIECENDFWVKYATGTPPNYKPYGVKATTIGGNLIVGSSDDATTGFGNYYIPSSAYNSHIYISGSVILNGGDLFLSTDDGPRDFHIYGNLINNGGSIYDAEDL